jgi:hypothetical protein
MLLRAMAKVCSDYDSGYGSYSVIQEETCSVVSLIVDK